MTRCPERDRTHPCVSEAAYVAIPLEFEVDKRGRATDVPVPLDLTSLKFLGKMALTVPLLVALAAHLAEPGLLTKDKSKNQ